MLDVAAALKPEADYTLVGQSLPRSDLAAKVSGAAVYVHDMRLPGMQHGGIVPAQAQTFEMGDRTAVPPYAYADQRITVHDMAPICVPAGCAVSRPCPTRLRMKASSTSWPPPQLSIRWRTACVTCPTRAPPCWCAPLRIAPAGCRTRRPSASRHRLWMPRAMPGCQARALPMPATSTASSRGLARPGRPGWPMCRSTRAPGKCMSAGWWWATTPG